MGYYTLVGKEQDKKLKSVLKTYMLTDINKRRDYVKTLSLGTVERAMGIKAFFQLGFLFFFFLSRTFLYKLFFLQTFTGQLPHILPDYMLVFAVPILAHDPEFTSHLDVDHLKVIQQCLTFILEPLITKNEYYCYGFYKNLIERMKCHKDALRYDDDNTNSVITLFLAFFELSNAVSEV